MEEQRASEGPARDKVSTKPSADRWHIRRANYRATHLCFGEIGLLLVELPLPLKPSPSPVPRPPATMAPPTNSPVVLPATVPAPAAPAAPAAPGAPAAAPAAAAVSLGGSGTKAQATRVL